MYQPDNAVDVLMEAARTLRDHFEALRDELTFVAETQELGFDGGEALATGLMRAALYVAGADGPLDGAEWSFIACMTGHPITQHHAAIIRQQMVEDRAGHVEHMIKILEGAVLVNSLAQSQMDPDGYDASTDAVAQLVSELGNVLIAVAAYSDPVERRLGEVMGRLSQRALEIEVEWGGEDRDIEPASGFVMLPKVTQFDAGDQSGETMMYPMTPGIELFGPLSLFLPPDCVGLKRQAVDLDDLFERHSVEANVVRVTIGPVLTTFMLNLGPGVRFRQVAA